MQTGTAVAISEDIVLDFSGLFSGEPVEEEPDRQTEEAPADLDAGERVEEQAKKLSLEAQRERDAYERSREVYRIYQENTRTSEQLQNAILKGVAAGEDVYSLFLKAVKVVSLMTHDELFYRQLEADLAAIYGRGLQEKPQLDKELQDAKTRLQRLIEAENRERGTDDGERISRAVRAHRAKIDELEKMIQREERG